MRKYLDNSLQWIRINAHFQTPVQVLERLIFIVLIMYVLHWFPAKELIWSKDSPLMPVYMESGIINNFFLRLSYVRSSADLVIWTHIIGLICAFIPLFGRFFKLLVFVSGWMMYYGAPTLFGNEFPLLMNLVFILLLTSRNPKRNKLEIALSNLAWLGLIAQACIHFVFWGISFFSNFDLLLENSWAIGAMDAVGEPNFIRTYFATGALDLNPVRFALFIALPFVLLRRKVAIPVLIASFLMELLWINVSGLHLEGSTVLILLVFLFLSVYPKKIKD